MSVLEFEWNGRQVGRSKLYIYDKKKTIEKEIRPSKKTGWSVRQSEHR